MSKIPFQIIDWNKIQVIEATGAKGTSQSKAVTIENIQIRMVEYSKGYLSDHWCKKGHIVHCLEGGFVTELENDDKFKMSTGMTFIVSDNIDAHRTYSKDGVKLLIIDGDFLK